MKMNDKNSLRMYPLSVLWLLIFIFFFGACSKPPGKNVKIDTFKMLSDTRKTKKKKVLAKLNKLMDKANKASEDEVLLKIFVNLRKKIKKPSLSINVPPGYDSEIDRAYVERYYDFYDILFIDAGGRVFYTVRRESDFGDSIYSGKISGTRLSKSLRENPDIEFIDYHYYSPSKEAAAFFVTRVENAGKQIGWIALQFSINCINSILTDHKGLGETGEVYLTNNQKLMLTRSRFFPHDSSLNRKIETTALSKALEGESGNEIIKDYRGIRVFSSFEKFDFADAVWVMVAEIDEEEVITQHYREHEEYYSKEIFSRLKEGDDIPPCHQCMRYPNIRVDINEYAKAERNETAATYGVTTCTGVLISYPEKFAYLGHLYPLDSTYYSRAERTFLDVVYGLMENAHGDGISDVLGDMLRNLKHHDIYPSEIRKLRIVLIAVHTKSFRNIIDNLLDAGIFLSQIKIMHRPRMSYANICTDVNKGHVAVQWIKSGSTSIRWAGSDNINNLEDEVKRIADYEGGTNFG